ncbi:MAG: GGDEF domain-containing protein, partial [Alkalispirochaeta sp.]
IDHFKHVNDTYGHLTGDRVLKGLSRLLQDRLRRTDVVGRYGGEEFGVILFNTDLKNAKRLLDELRDSFSRLRQSNGETDFRVTFSCGIAAFPDFDTVSDLNEAADGALYRAKEAGRNRVVSAAELLDDESTPGST